MIKFKRLNEKAILPERATDGSAGFDIHATERVEIWPGAQAKIPTGIACVIPDNCVGLIWPRSGLAVKFKLSTNAGVIDSDYRGEIHICMINHGDRMYEIKAGDRIAQMIVQPYLGTAIEVDNLDDTSRGSQGFGSTGI